MTNIEKAKALIGSFVTGDLTVAEEVLTDGYIQQWKILIKIRKYML